MKLLNFVSNRGGDPLNQKQVHFGHNSRPKAFKALILCQTEAATRLTKNGYTLVITHAQKHFKALILCQTEAVTRLTKKTAMKFLNLVSNRGAARLTKKTAMKFLFSLFCYVLLAICFQVQAQPQPNIISGQVVRIIDGDNFDLLKDSKRVRCRIAEIDAPERNQPYGQNATDSLAKLLLNRPVVCLGLGRDLYLRRLVKVYQIDNQAVNLDSVLVSNGWAWSMKGWRRGSYDPNVDPNQVQAKLASRGLWQCNLPVLPSIWRNLNAANKRKINSCN
jgi:micrococcal nuclease